MNKTIKSLYFPTVILFLGFTSLSVQAAIYKCENESGKTFYVDKPCPVNNTETELQAVKDPINGYIPPEFVLDKPDGLKKGVVIGKEVESSDNKNDKSNDSDSINGSQDNSSNSLTNSDSPNQSESEIASERTESDKLFNEKLKTNSKSSTNGESELSGDLLVLEPQGK